ncbi:MAG: SufD family Fe-S cluster assembly protein, partial [Alicyclobacillus sp.]|nr:SufD family Fe-S cluster assembly protein [Alicyclobacillus sp.]
MTQELSTVQSWLQEQAKAHAEPEWLRQMRERAWEAFQNAPVVRLEKTDLSRRTWDVVPPTVAAVAETGAEAGQLIQSLTEQSDAYVYVRDGQVVQVRVPADWSETGVIVADLHSAAQQHADLVQQYLGQVVLVEESKWSALNAAVWQGGLFVYVPRRVSVPGTVHYVVEDTGSGVGIAPRALVIADAESRLAFAEVHISSGDKPSGPVRSHVLEVIAKSGAKVTVVTNHAFHAGPTNFSTSRARVENDASVDWVFSNVGDGFT